LAIAKRVAADGANVAPVAKTAEPIQISTCAAPTPCRRPACHI
jgi:hypothetical protein